MAFNINRATLIGNAGKDAEISYTGNGRAVAKFSLATSESWTDKNTGQKEERTDWHNIVAWAWLAEFCNENVKKGKRIFVEGRIQTRSYEQDGVKKYMTEIVANDVQVIERGAAVGGNSTNRSENTPHRSASPAAGPAPMPEPEYEQQSAPADDLPF
jgi:single-strand DNA-binding protein